MAFGRGTSRTERWTAASPVTPHAGRVLVWLLLALAFSLPVAGCGGCGDASILEEEETAEAELEKEKDKAQKKKEKPKKDFEDPKLHVYPQVPAPNRASLLVKPGHWNTAVEEMKANNFDFPGGELRATLESRTGGALAVEHTPFYVTTSRRAPLAKGVLKFFDVEYFVPVGTALPRMSVELRNERGGGAVMQNYEYFRLLGPHQYYFVVLSDTPEAYMGFRDMDSLAAPGFEGLTPDARHYALVLPRVKKRVPLPTNSLSWTSIAYVIWDDLDPATLDDDQQRAMLDWLHWGGQLIVSGPGTLDKLKGSFLDPPAPAASYLPAAAGESIKLSQELIAEIAGPWTIPGNGGASRRLVTTSAWSAIELKLHAQGNYVPNTAKQVAERRVGRGRIAVTSFRIRERNLRTWPCFDGFLNAVLLRREPRAFFKNVGMYDETGKNEVGVGWAKHPPAVDRATPPVSGNTPDQPWPNHMTDARLTTTLRYFSRDLNQNGEFATRGEVSVATAFDPSGNFQGGFPTPGWPSPQALAKDDEVESQTDEEGNALITGKVLPHGSGIGGWNDFDGVSAAGRTSLRQAAGIRIPDGSFVLFVLTVYLALLVPLNWLIFRTIGRVELAWVAAPLIAVGGASAVIKLAQLDIGFARSQTEVAVLEVHADYPRAHLTRYTALYSSLTTEYDLVFDDKHALAMPFATDPEFQLLRSQGLSPVNLYRDEEEARLSGYRVQSNSTSMVHSEQMADLGGVISYQEKDGRHELFNRTKYPLTSAGVIRKVDDRMEAAYLGDLKEGSAVAVRFDTAPSEPPLLPQWDKTSTTDERDVPLTRLLKLAQEGEQLEPGEVRLVAVIKQSLPGLSVEPAASQNDRSATVVVATLRRPSLAGRPPQRDTNSRYDISEKKYTPDEETEVQ